MKQSSLQSRPKRSELYSLCLLYTLTLFLFNSCGFKVSSFGSNLTSGNTISGIISPLIGQIAENQNSTSFLFSQANATACADPVYAKLYQIQSDGSISDSDPLSEQLIGSDAKYSFNLASFNSSNSNVQFLVKAEGCNGDVFKRPITAVDDSQNIDAKTTVVAEVMNSNTTKKLNEVDRKDIEQLIKSLSGSNKAEALDSLYPCGKPA